MVGPCSPNVASVCLALTGRAVTVPRRHRLLSLTPGGDFHRLLKGIRKAGLEVKDRDPHRVMNTRAMRGHNWTIWFSHSRPASSPKVAMIIAGRRNTSSI
jgi:hypothetical protein